SKVSFSLAKQIGMLGGTGLVSWGAIVVLMDWRWNAVAAKVAAEGAILILVAVLRCVLHSKEAEGKT
ncbi:MAG TPA: hypothetical protein VL986_12585, partial [Terracidiphilus sp.]|nr:hypothetical protein [Terracidiphilus sp.]